jgi:alginate O-acetyltransferase complex protein AlgI
MLFCTFDFLVFFVGVFTLYWAMPWPKARVWLLVVGSFYFYAAFNRWLALVVGVSTAVDYCLALGMDRPGASQRLRRALLCVSIVANLGLLCYFKYVNFFLESFYAACGWALHSPILQVILPVGISFYTFEAINYTVDVYRRRTPAERSLPHFLLFITFFPHLVAGPIVRARDFLPQIKRPKRWSWQRLNLGGQFFVLGLFKKLAIADRMALFADPVFKDPGGYGTGAIWLAVVAYAVQIYCDFSGYTDMAIGCAHMLGYKLAKNFDMPYLAVNVSEFWRRWHISLSTWLRDYLFIPLGGSRGSNWQTSRNLFITMALGGLWHGAAWTFVVWGVLHGSYLVVHRAFRDCCKTRPALDAALQSAPGTMLRWCLTFLAVCVGWVFFRAQTFKAAACVLQRMFVPAQVAGAPLPAVGLWLLLAVVAASHLAGIRGAWRRWSDHWATPALGFGYAAALMLALVLAPNDQKTFIYFQF